MHPLILARAIFFDAVGTLFRIRGGVGQIYWEAARPYGVRATPLQIEAAFQKVFPLAPPLAFSRVQSHLLRRSEKEWWYRIVREVFERVGMIRNFKAYFEEVFRIFAGIRGWELYPETRQVLKDLKKQGFLLGIISNFDSRILTVCTDLQIYQYFDSIHISSRIGAAKPDPMIFRKAISHHGLRPDQCVYVGDEFKDDVEGARGAGMTPIYLNREGKSPLSEGVVVIKSLVELWTRVKPI